MPYLQSISTDGNGRKVFFEVHGCQMNVNDTEIIWSILKKKNFFKTNNLNEADVILIVTCAIRDSAEQKIWGRFVIFSLYLTCFNICFNFSLNFFKGIKKRNKHQFKKTMKIGILGCMAERLKEKVLEKEQIVDLVAGPDSYKDLPRMLALTDNDHTAVNVLLSLDETYADVMPLRLNESSVSAFV